MPAPCSAFCALSGPRIAVRNACHDRWSPIETTLCERSGSYMPRIEAWAKISVPPRRGRMLVVAFNLCRASEMALHQQRAGVSAERHRRGIEHGTAGNHFFRLADIGNDRLERKFYASGHAGQSHATRPSPSGNRGAKRNRPTRTRLWEIRGAELPENRGCGQALPGCASIPGRSSDRSSFDLRADRFRSSLPFLAGANVFALFFRRPSSKEPYFDRPFSWLTARDPCPKRREAISPLRMTWFSYQVFHLWHVLQLVMSLTLRTLYFFTNAVPNRLDRYNSVHPPPPDVALVGGW
jgi:hypothetical protein